MFFFPDGEVKVQAVKLSVQDHPAATMLAFLLGKQFQRTPTPPQIPLLKKRTGRSKIKGMYMARVLTSQRAEASSERPIWRCLERERNT